jgi:hypothetical protein
VTNYYRRS